MERMKGENQPRYIDIGVVDTERVLARLDRRLSIKRSELNKTLGAKVCEEDVVVSLRGDFVRQLSSSPRVIRDLGLAAGLISVDALFLDDEADLINNPPLNIDGIIFAASAAFAYQQIEKDLWSKGFVYSGYDKHIEPIVESWLPPDGRISTEDARLWGNSVFEDGRDIFETRRNYWQPILDQHAVLFESEYHDLSRAEAGVGYMISLLTASSVLAKSIATHNDRITQNGSNRNLLAEFERELEAVKNLSDLKWGA